MVWRTNAVKSGESLIIILMLLNILSNTFFHLSFWPSRKQFMLDFIISVWGHKKDLIFLEYSKELDMMFH